MTTAPPPPRKNALPARASMGWLAAGAVLAASAGAGFWLRDGLAALPAASTASKADHPAVPRGVRALRVGPSASVERRSHAGVVAARWETPLSFRVAGRIAERRVELGRAVAAGEVLFALDPSDYEAYLRAAQAELAAAQAQDRQAGAEAARQTELLRRGFATLAAHERAVAAAAAASEQVEAAAQKLVLARNQRDYASLTAPHDGVVTALSAESGEVVAPGRTVLTLARTTGIEALVAIPETQIDDLSQWRAAASLWGQDDRPEAVTLRERAAQADAASRTFAARFALPAALAARARLGASLTVHLERDAAAGGATVPASAVFFRAGRSFVWRVSAGGDRVEALPVAVLALAADAARIAGPAEGDLIVTLGVHRLDPDLPIRVIEGTRAQASAP